MGVLMGVRVGDMKNEIELGDDAEQKVSFRNNGRRDEEARMALAQNGEWRRAEWREGVGRKRGKHSKEKKRSERERKRKKERTG